MCKGVQRLNSGFYLRAGWLIDGTGGPIRRRVLMKIDGEVIVSLEEDPQGDLPSHAIDLSHCTLVAGLVDCHVHLFMSGTADQAVRERQLRFDFKQVRPVISRHIGEHLSHGVVALRDGGDYAGHTLRFKKESLPEERLPIYLKSPGRAWRARSRYGRLIGRPPLAGYTLAQSIALREEENDHIKIVNSGLNSLHHFGKETPPQFSLEELRAAVQTGESLGLKTMVHANGRLPVSLALRAGCHSIEHGFFMGRENLQRLADLQAFWIPTAYTMKGYAEQLPTGSLEAEIARRNLDHQLEQLSLARQIGVPVAVGTDCGSLGVHHGRAFLEELVLLRDAGFALENAIQCATLNGARLLGLEGELGTVKRGMPATFVAVPGGPSRLYDSLASPESVYIRGTRVTVDV